MFRPNASTLLRYKYQILWLSQFLVTTNYRIWCKLGYHNFKGHWTTVVEFRLLPPPTDPSTACGSVGRPTIVQQYALLRTSPYLVKSELTKLECTAVGQWNDRDDVFNRPRLTVLHTSFHIPCTCILTLRLWPGRPSWNCGTRRFTKFQRHVQPLWHNTGVSETNGRTDVSLTAWLRAVHSIAQ